MKTITHTQAQQIIDIACITWKVKLAAKWSKEIVLKEIIEISDNDYQEMRKACTSEQNELFDVIFGEESKFKVGDWVYVIDAKSGAKGANHCIGQITNEISNMGLLSWEDGINISIGSKVWKVNIKSELRLATEEEIQKAQYIPEGTPCLVRDLEEETWKFAYSSGDGKFRTRISNLGWRQVQVLDMNNLPKY